jgi:hypothetical protein
MVSWRVSHLFGSAICQIFEKIRKILVVPVCHHCTPAIGYFSESRLLAMIGSPWPMTAAETEASEAAAAAALATESGGGRSSRGIVVGQLATHD